MKQKRNTNIEKKRAKVYIDGANIFYTQKKLGWSVDWQKVKQLLEKEWSVIEWRYYTGVKLNDSAMAKYLKKLDEIGFTVITKPLKTIYIDRHHILAKTKNYQYIYKSNFDVEIATDLAFDRTKVNFIILFSGDSDFEYVVKRLKNVGIYILVYSSRKTLSWELKLVANEYRYLEDAKYKISRRR